MLSKTNYNSGPMSLNSDHPSETVHARTLSKDLEKTALSTAFPFVEDIHNVSPAVEFQTTKTALPIFPGPEIQGRKTSIMRLNHAQLSQTPLLPALVEMVNDAFRVGGKSKNILDASDRFQSDAEFPNHIGADPDTFTYVVSWADDPTSAVGTLGARRYALSMEYHVFNTGDAAKDELLKEAYRVFGRSQAPARRLPEDQAEMEMWELNVMAIDPRLQRQGLAGYLLQLTEDEVRQRSREIRASKPFNSGKGVELVMVMTTIVENNGAFYSKRGYDLDYKKWNSVGTMGTAVGFTVGRYSKLL